MDSSNSEDLGQQAIDIVRELFVGSRTLLQPEEATKFDIDILRLERMVKAMKPQLKYMIGLKPFIDSRAKVPVRDREVEQMRVLYITDRLRVLARSARLFLRDDGQWLYITHGDREDPFWHVEIIEDTRLLVEKFGGDRYQLCQGLARQLRDIFDASIAERQRRLAAHVRAFELMDSFSGTPRLEMKS